MTTALTDLLADAIGEMPTSIGTVGTKDTSPSPTDVPDPATEAKEDSGAAKAGVGASRSALAAAVAAAHGEQIADTTAVIDHVDDRDHTVSSQTFTAQAVVRPNGQTYHSRSLDGTLSDVDALRIARDHGLHILLDGPPGAGKSALVEAAFGAELFTVAGHQDLAVEHLMGSWVPDGAGGYCWVQGPLPAAMKAGAVLFVDDATLVLANVLASMYPAMDGRNTITVDDNGREQVTATDGFLVVAAHNPGVPGAILSEALDSRLTLKIHMATDYDLAQQLGVDHRVVRLAKMLDRNAEEWNLAWVPQMRDLLAFRDVVAALGEQVAVANLVGCIPETDLDTTLPVVHTLFPGVMALGVRAAA